MRVFSIGFATFLSISASLSPMAAHSAEGDAVVFGNKSLSQLSAAKKGLNNYLGCNLTVFDLRHGAWVKTSNAILECQNGQWATVGSKAVDPNASVLVVCFHEEKAFHEGMIVNGFRCNTNGTWAKP